MTGMTSAESDSSISAWALVAHLSDPDPVARHTPRLGLMTPGAQVRMLPPALGKGPENGALFPFSRFAFSGDKPGAGTSSAQGSSGSPDFLIDIHQLGRLRRYLT